ncbi:hypothetical protein FAZ95_14185 [Trinickia violacea]|uniref:Uncharacterized protein n=1 Tax=Trinickia violacea TaxID=2571746 RepID=A0A4P8IQE0_9BURK|nr:hypothetical protein [Trinickia violacea]QCP50227.1 hypothetical protein FAZ95_14185 [Trinickia violacea]
MATAGKSLRRMVEHWLSPEPGQRVRVTEFRNKHARYQRYVRIETSKASGPVALIFFRHQDGTWCIYPPRPEFPTMRVA